ncbi:DUF2752 domain-containing protein [Streptomyces sp. JJ38]|uniref:DUF2752 domain-containing protein n=1 Tax=Streptomyces sp. JJ38 TaxID=2738128 RepID=UPI001C59358C|nr:DUF2752 domain-containing protein [Streptomyces sp. JJ38]MBW1599376.1 DUF2752 domain-containing protein [Streptomyces sp. JJ38]
MARTVPPRPAPAGRPAPLAALAVTVAGTAWLGVVDPAESGLFPPCPVPRLTGLLCPGCGGLRAVHGLAGGEFGVALGANALVVLGAAALAVLWLAWWLRPERPPRVRAWHAGVVLAVACGFTVVRNLPFGAALAP